MVGLLYRTGLSTQVMISLAYLRTLKEYWSLQNRDTDKQVSFQAKNGLQEHQILGPEKRARLIKKFLQIVNSDLIMAHL